MILCLHQDMRNKVEEVGGCKQLWNDQLWDLERGGRASLDPRLGLRGSPSARGAFVDPRHFWRQPWIPENSVTILDPGNDDDDDVYWH